MVSNYQYLNRRRLSKIHLILTDEHKLIPILQCPSFLTLVARTGNFIPTPVASQLNSIVHKSLNIFFVRVYNTLSKYVHRKFFNTCDITTRAAGISNWRPKLFPHNSVWYAQRRKFIFSSSNHVWRNNSSLCPELPSILSKFGADIMSKTEAICKSLHGCKWRNLSAGERIALCDFRKQTELRICKADKNLGPVVVSDSIYVEQLKLHLYDPVGTYEELVGVDTTTILRRMHDDFHIIARNFSRHVGFKSLCRTFNDWHSASLSEPRLCSIYLLWKEHKPPDARGVRTRAIIPNNGYYTCQISKFLHEMLASAVDRHPFILRDSLSLIRVLEEHPAHRQIRIATYDVTALYPSIDLNEGISSLRWFLKTFCQ